jgi:hypothetical protein
MLSAEAQQEASRACGRALKPGAAHSTPTGVAWVAQPLVSVLNRSPITACLSVAWQADNSMLQLSAVESADCTAQASVLCRADWPGAAGAGGMLTADEDDGSNVLALPSPRFRPGRRAHCAHAQLPRPWQAAGRVHRSLPVWPLCVDRLLSPCGQCALTASCPRVAAVR